MTFIMVPRRGCLLCLRVLAVLLGAAAEQQVNVLAQTSMQVPDQGTQTSRREAAHSEVTTPMHGLSELQTTLDSSVIATPCPALTPTLHLCALPSPDPSKAPLVDRFVPLASCDPEHARGMRCDSGVNIDAHNATDSFAPLPPGLPAHHCQGAIGHKDSLPRASPRFDPRGGTTRNGNEKAHAKALQHTTTPDGERARGDSTRAGLSVSLPGCLSRSGESVDGAFSNALLIVLPFLTVVLTIACIVLPSPCPSRPSRRRPLTLFNLAVVLCGIGHCLLQLAIFRCMRRLGPLVRFIAWPLVLLVRLVRWIDRLAFALCLLAYGIIMVLYGYSRLVALLAFDSIISWMCWLFCVPYHYEGVLDEALMISSDNDWDARKYPKCKPYFGKRGVEFEKFVRDFGAAIAGDGDDDASLEDTMLGMDPGGDAPGAPAAIAGAAPARRRAKRLRDLYAALYRHIPEPRLREMMHATARNDGRAVFRMLEANCRQVIDDLELLQMDGDWNTATILNSVGYSVDSVTLFSRHLNGLNALRPAANRKTEDELTTKFLACIDTNIEATLAHEAKKELRAHGGARQFVNAVTGTRDFQACVTFFDDLWRSHFRTGDIRPRPRQTTTGGGSSRADAGGGCSIRWRAPRSHFTGRDVSPEPYHPGQAIITTGYTRIYCYGPAYVCY